MTEQATQTQAPSSLVEETRPMRLQAIASSLQQVSGGPDGWRSLIAAVLTAYARDDLRINVCERLLILIRRIAVGCRGQITPETLVYSTMGCNAVSAEWAEACKLCRRLPGRCDLNWETPIADFANRLGKTRGKAREKRIDLYEAIALINPPNGE